MNVELRNEKWLRDMHRELSTIDLVSTCPPDPAQAGWKGGEFKVAGIKVPTPLKADPLGSGAEMRENVSFLSQDSCRSVCT